MTHTVIGIFTDRADAETVITQLKDDGYNPKEMSIILKDKAEAETIAHNTGADAAANTVGGATTGAMLGALAGLLAATVIPGLGAFLIGGPIAAALGLTGAAASTVSGAATGALAGGLIGALTSLGVSEEDARIYEERIKEGGILLAVPVSDEKVEDVRGLMTEHDASDVRSVSSADTPAINRKGGRARMRIRTT